MSRHIHLLPEHLVNQIKAGEVIERPAMLIKEILENSIDAKATKIQIHIVNNGLDKIEIIDNGEGISYEDLPLAFCRHATSKLKRFEDLSHLYSFGFRGEALASIAAISKVSCVSKRKDETCGEIIIHGSEEVSHNLRQHFPTESGTHLIIENLFFNTPARLKFIQSETSEKNQIKKILYGYILAHPHINFIVQMDNNEKEEYLAFASDDYGSRINEYKNKTEQQIKPSSAHKNYDGIDLLVYWVPAPIKLKHRLDYLFINNRFVKDPSLLKIAGLAFEKWNQEGQFVVFCNIPTEHLDVNVHPNKTIVKYFEPAKLIQLMNSTIASLFESTSKLAPTPVNVSEKSQFQFEQPLDQNEKPMDLGFYQTMEAAFELPTTQQRDQLVYLFKNEGIGLLKNHEGKLYSLNFLHLYMELIEQIFFFKQEPTPLLVSQKLTGFKFSKLERSYLLELGFEIDELASGFYLLRSYPQCLENVYNEHILATLLKSIDFKEKALNKKIFHEEYKKLVHLIPEVIHKSLLQFFSSDIFNKAYIREVLAHQFEK